MKRVVSAALLLCLALLLCPAALAQGASYIPDDCGQETCTCFIQVGDEGGVVEKIVELLIERGYLETGTAKTRFTEAVEQAVIQFQQDNGLTATGTMGDDTLTLLIWQMLPEELDAAMPVDPALPETYPDMAYVPTDGGKKRHGKAGCSGMLDPRKVSIRNAAKLGFDACKKCAVGRESSLH